MSNISKIYDELIKLQRAYALTYRAPTTEERHKCLIGSGLIREYSYDSEFIRDPLIEHTGHLPIIASFLHGKLKNYKKIDLGRALVMLSIHDFGETVVGDVITYKKNVDHQKAEYDVAKKFLPKYLFEYFQEFEQLETMDAKFAKAVDALAPLLHELVIPEVTLERFAHFGFNTDSIVSKKTKYFEFDPVLKDLFAYTIKLFKKIEAGSKKLESLQIP